MQQATQQLLGCHNSWHRILYILHDTAILIAFMWQLVGLLIFLAELKYHLFTVVFFPCSSIDNGPIQCKHGKVPASKVTSMKRLSSVAWEKLYLKVINPTSCFALH
jgi:hypothetical protein